MAGRSAVSAGLSWQQWRDPEAVIVCGLGSGFLPRAPGTFGSLVAVLIWWALLAPLGWIGQLVVIGAVTALGVWLVGRVQARYG
ncbi:MAG: phosphatidylglycerophosphatase A, partial [Gammaproteobacteria bacterium]